MTEYDAIVIGVGAMGAAACAHLAARGARVLGLERFAIPHEHGSSGGDTRLFRTAYFEHPDYVPLLRRARAGWEHLESRTGARVFDETGVLYAGPPDGELIPATESSARAYGVEVEEVADAPSRHPAFRIPGEYRVLFEPGAGFVRSLAAIRAFAGAARADGAELHEGERVVEWEERGAGVRVRTDAGAYEANRLVLTAGAWTPQVAPGLAGRLTPTRQVVGWVEPRAPSACVPPAFPCWAIEDPEDGLYYGFPLVDGPSTDPARRGLKIGRHVPGPPIDPDHVAPASIAGDEPHFRRGVERYLGAVGGVTTAVTACLYTMSPDGHFMVGPLPDHDAAVVACGFSGHGFKFAPVIGEALADLALEGRTELPVGFLSPLRGDRAGGAA